IRRLFSCAQRTRLSVIAHSGSFYDTFDQSGNVVQWNDLDGAAGSSRGLRGGYFGANYGGEFPVTFGVSSSYSKLSNPSGDGFAGIRLASPVSSSAVPEIDPNGLSAVLGLIVGGLGLLERRRYGR
ncbi:MAG: hypothetical protein WCJ31_21290, partial [Planctomycetia bacterium]